MKTLLIANRGEIAERVRRTAADMGMRTVAIYSDADANMPIVMRADMAVALGGVSPAESYLDMDKVLDAAARTGADAIHPGYGFLSENAEFARRVTDAGLVWVGPSADAIDAMGDKARAKRAMIEAGVPTVPGFQEDGATDAQLTAAAGKVGYPLMVKAAAGGGGRGMRRVNGPDALADAIASARSEAENAFGNGELILERLVENARHVEVQVFGDSHGHVIHLSERDCSVQRRHQKVIEEAPSPAVDAPLRAKMGEAAVRAAKAVDYVGAGTVEFLLGEDGDFYFLEMNTRLQVEHPVTEEVTGLDLVELQLRVARGEALGLSQDDIELNGHSIEARLYAEDPANGFLPQAGDITALELPVGARVDTGLDLDTEAQTIPSAYDPMIAKVISWGETRAEAVDSLRAALAHETLVGGIPTNRDFLISVLDSEVFRAGDATTGWLDAGFGADYRAPAPGLREARLAAVLLHLNTFKRMSGHGMANTPDELIGFSNWAGLSTPYVLKCGDDEFRFHVRSTQDRIYTVSIEGGEGESGEVEVRLPANGSAVVDGESFAFARRWPTPSVVVVGTDRGQFTFRDISGGEPAEDDGAGSGIVRAPMHGALLSVDVAEGDTVVEGQRLGTLEAMKMQHPLRAAVAGTVRRVAASAGAQVASGDVLLEIEAAGEG